MGLLEVSCLSAKLTEQRACPQGPGCPHHYQPQRRPLCQAAKRKLPSSALLWGAGLAGWPLGNLAPPGAPRGPSRLRGGPLLL